MIKPIETETEYTDALVRAHELLQEDLNENDKSSDELEKLNLLIKEYESVHYPFAYLNLLRGSGSV